MRRISTAVGMMVLLLAAVDAGGQSQAPKPAPELKQADIWVGNWTLSGTAKDTPTGPEYRLDLLIHSHWVLGGFFLETNSSWKGNGQQLQTLEIASYDAINKTCSVSAFASDGMSWNATFTVSNGVSIENVTTTTPDGNTSTCRGTFVFSSDREAVSGAEECEQSGVRWTAFKVKGTKSKTAR